MKGSWSKQSAAAQILSLLAGSSLGVNGIEGI